MERTLKNYFLLLLKGMAMGAADVVPGVSGGTIALISGIYQELIETISNLNFSLIKTWKQEGFKAFWKKGNANFLLAIVSGIFISALSIMNLMHYLLEHHPIQIWSFFFGLVLSSVFFVGKQVEKWSIYNGMFLIMSAFLSYFITTLSTSSSSDNLLFLFLSGAIAICAMILPGISGSFILVLLGSYATISTAIHNLEIKKLIIFMLGCFVGLLSFSKLLKWLFTKHRNATLAILTGFILGSLNKIWPWKQVLDSILINGKKHIIKEVSILPKSYEGEPYIMWAIIFAILGFLLIFGLEKLASKNNAQN